MARKEQEPVETPISSMIDVVFLLLIFFVVTQKEYKPESHLTVMLPAPSLSSSDEPPPPQFELVIEANGRYIWSPGTPGGPISYEDLCSRVKTLTSNPQNCGPKGPMIFIKVSRKAQSKHVIRALDVFNQGLGMKNMSLTAFD